MALPQFVEDFKANKLDAVGEIENITMGSAATAVSTLLNAKVWITTPQVDVCKGSEIVFPELEPAIHVRIEYIEGIEGFSLLVLKQADVQMILNQLMGLPLVVTDDFEFDEINISAVCEVMNQMMGASSTALSEILGKRIDISTPQAIVSNGDVDILKTQNISPDEYICTISFALTIDGVINSKFVTLLDMNLAGEMADMMANQYTSSLDDYTPPPEETGEAPLPKTTPKITAEPTPAPAPAAAPVPVPVPDVPVAQPAVAPTPVPVVAPAPMPAMPEYTPPAPPVYTPPPGYGAPPLPPQMQQPIQQQYAPPPQYYYPPPPPPHPVPMQRSASFGSLDMTKFTAEQKRNLNLLMNVPMEVSIEVGSTSKRIDEILDFTQGTVFELDRSASAPVDIVVNGSLIAKGEVVVVDDNFAVKIIEIMEENLTDMVSQKV